MCFGAEKVITAYSENSFNKPVIVNTDNSSLDYSSNKNINLCGENVTWSPDGKKILFFSANEDIVKNYISFKDKNEVNIITFK